VKFHIHMLLTCRIYLNHDSDRDRSYVNFWFGHWGCRSNLLYNIGGGPEKCYIVLHRVGGWFKNTIFVLGLYNNVYGPSEQLSMYTHLSFFIGSWAMSRQNHPRSLQCQR